MLVVVISGVYSWGLTVLPQVATTGPASPTGLFARLAIVALLAAPVLPPGRIALTAALDVFLGACILAWFFGRDHPMDPPLAVFGSFGWLSYTLALGSLSTPLESDTERNPAARNPAARNPAELNPGPHLDPRTRPSRLSAAVLLACLLACLAVIGAAWTVKRPAVAVLAHVFALSTVLVILRSSAHLATYLQVRTTKLKVRPRLGPAAWPLVALAVLAAAAVVWAFLSG
jgi:hypothetical protein